MSNKPCPVVEYAERSQCLQVEQELICKGGITREWMTGIRVDISHLRLIEWPGLCIHAGRVQQLFPELRTLELINCSSLEFFKGHFGSTSKIQKLTIHGSPSLWEVPPGLIDCMPGLRILDLRRNGIRHMRDELLSRPPNLQEVHLSENQWDCSDGGLDWLAMKEENSTTRKRIADYKILVCHQKLYRGKPLHVIMDIIRTMHLTCPSPCECKMTHVVSDTAGTIIPLITVNCAERQLEAPPSTLPPSSTTLRLEGNKISSIRAIIQNPLYKKLADLYLDNNSIPAVKELEGSEWFTTFRVLSLRGNKLKQIPVYAFDKALQVNNNIMHVYLGHNPWRCDCHFIPRFQGLLLKYKRVIGDLPDIRCSKSDDKKTSLVQISTMPLGNVCSSEMEMPISPINIVNLVLLTLILLVLGRFLYDWRNFKTTGKLPWLSSILP
ncbi:unnamed protein product [Chilo suppressalis]|uniref:LRRCT domain-containing protein n=1 Tax=Chilo suppressalis TaxID=168631 RepID=A0ABN8E9U3_CHISP|nr:hypothetical protein evm_003796 [Chilo suppressalis]CAH0669609.1 unnamed protein product [Chilo suppressalis]